MGQSMKWEKLDFCFSIEHHVENCPYRGAAVPFAYELDNGLHRIYYTARDQFNRSHIFYMDMDIATLNIVHVHQEPILSPGELGAFDDSGTMMSWITNVGETLYLYYIGWNRGVTVPFRNSIGLAVSHDGINFEKMFQGPIVDRSKTEPHFCASSSVLKQDGIFKMWYLSCTGWTTVQGAPRHHYHIKYAESKNGIDWVRTGRVAIDYKDEGEYAISRPCVVVENGLYKMWYSYRGEAYRIGYAESSDGITWKRKDEEAGIDVSSDGFDSKMIEYPFVFLCGGHHYMLFNGNEFGQTGFGIAKLVSEDGL